MASAPTAIAYTVTAYPPDAATADEYAHWLAADHLPKVVAAGALTASVVRMSDPVTPLRIECRYLFPNKTALDAYLTDHAPALRAEGMVRFPANRGIRLERSVGVVLFVLGS
jgi:hypothetical protein